MQPSMITPMIPSFSNISLINVILVGVIVGVFLLRKVLQRRAPAYGPTWGCGYSAGDARHQYTSTSYSEYLAELSGPVVPGQREYTPIAESEIFPVARSFKTVTRDIVEEEVVKKPVRKIIDRMTMIGWAQTGKINHYLIYPLFFLLIIVMLTRFGII